jgi:hypothetical protein
MPWPAFSIMRNLRIPIALWPFSSILYIWSDVMAPPFTWRQLPAQHKN